MAYDGTEPVALGRRPHLKVNEVLTGPRLGGQLPSSKASDRLPLSRAPKLDAAAQPAFRTSQRCRVQAAVGV
jgi:hypothetical protein